MVRKIPDPSSSLYDFMAYYLRFLRMQRGLTQAQVGEILGCSNAQISKYETGEKQLDARECALLDKAWDAGELFTNLRIFAEQGLDMNVPTRLNRYQRGAIEHHIFSNLIPLPLQTEEYARGILQAGHIAGYIDDADEAVSRRMDLQNAILDARPNLWVLMDQVALRPMGGPDVMEAQRDRLVELGALPHLSIRILPLSAAPHIGIDGPFWCFTMPDRRQAAYSGNALSVGRVTDDQREAVQVVERFQRLAARAWNEDQTREYLLEKGDDQSGVA